MTKHIPNKKSGFVALISAVIISAILLSLSLSEGAQEFSARFDALDAESRQYALALSKSCAAVALLRIGQNYSYAVTPSDSTVAITQNNCTIISLTYSTENASHEKTVDIITHGTMNHTWSTWETQAIIRNPLFPHDTSLSNITIQSQKEI